ncbi:MAG: six-hairpin glycosidase-like protein [Bacteroidota bacterium]
MEIQKHIVTNIINESKRKYVGLQFKNEYRNVLLCKNKGLRINRKTMNLKVKAAFIIGLLFFSAFSSGQEKDSQLWKISDDGGIVLRINSDLPLPLKDNIEMSGKKVSAIVYYEIDEDKNVTIKKDIIFPQLRIFNKTNEPDWKKYRAYFRRVVDSQFSPQISCDQKSIVHSELDSITINGMISFHYAPVNGLKLVKRLYPSMDDRLFVEEWQLMRTHESEVDFSISKIDHLETEEGYKGRYSFICKSQATEQVTLSYGQSYTFPVFHGALLRDELSEDWDAGKARNSRQEFLATCKNNLVLQTPDPILNTLFYFAKIRASESIFESSMGLVHSPGGGNYYVGIWANDQIEYSGPFFPYFGYGAGNTAAYNAYLKFLKHIPEDEHHIAYAFEVDANFSMTHLDRGDAAMIAYGTSLYVLNSGNVEQAKKLWPLIKWCLEYCESQKNSDGAIQSESDEMEGRIETGDANLSTSTLYYGGLNFSVPIAQELGMQEYAETLNRRKDAMEQVIENYFGATIQGFDSYRYFKENTNLRHWICLPLTMGITKRKQGTLDALFEKLWTENGILVEHNELDKPEEQVFWDRATLYALRGALKVGETERAINKVKEYSSKRLLGDHVPYPVEAYPENNMKHLSAESALYCRIFIEGVLGIEPMNFTAFKMSPNLPKDWDYLNLNGFYFFGERYDLSIHREDQKYRVMLRSDAQKIYDQLVYPKELIVIDVKK